MALFWIEKTPVPLRSRCGDLTIPAPSSQVVYSGYFHGRRDEGEVVRLGSRDICWAGEESSVSGLAFRDNICYNGTVTSPSSSVIIMATSSNSSTPGMGDIIQLNVGGTR